MRVRDRDWTWSLVGVLLATSVLVPVVFSTRLDAVFVVPKLGALWAALALSLGLVAVGVLATGRLPDAARVFPVVDGAVAVFVVLEVAAFAFSTDREQSLVGERLQYQGLLTVLLYMSFFYVARVAITDVRRLTLLLWAVSGGAALVSGYAIVQRAGLDPVWEGYLPGGRVFSSIGQANALAAYLVLTIPVSAALLLGGRLRLRVVAFLIVSATVTALVLTRSRGGFLGLVAALGVLGVGWWSVLRAPTKDARRTVAAVAAGVALVVAAASASALSRVSLDDASIRFHADAWRVAAHVAVEHPVLGTGPETFPDVFPRYSHAVLPPERAAALDAFRVESPHNVYLAIAAGSGIPALVAYLGILAGALVTVARAATHADRELRVALVAVLAAAAGHLVTDAFMTAEVTSSWLFWALLGGALGSIQGPPLDVTAGATPRRSR
ncbi:MAG TPA: O-antigen ligase family protein [Gaiellaceae bacterium]|nr:O-antigen ligase family protein [Gaiellaceae bacterium]